jgi:hypothetical protein
MGGYIRGVKCTFPYYFLLILRITTLTTSTTMKVASKTHLFEYQFFCKPIFSAGDYFVRTHILSSKIYTLKLQTH